MFVHVRWSDCPICVSHCHDVLDLRLTLADEGREVLDVNPSVRPLLQLKTFLLSIGTGFGQQITDFLLVDLQVAGSHQVLLLLVSPGDVVENVIKGPGNDPRVVGFAFHSVCLPGTSLTVGKYCSIESVQNCKRRILSRFLEKGQSVGVG